MGSWAVLVVDFGTTSTAAALVTGDRVQLIKEPSSGLYAWPSAVCADGDELLVGTAAERRKRADPAGYRAGFKRDLGETAPIPLGERSYPPHALVAHLLAVVRGQAAELTTEPLDRLLLTVPASVTAADPRRALMLAAGEQAGFAEVELLAEPVAAALAPVAGPAYTAGDLVLVYDFGGGTFDAALVRGRHEVLGHTSLADAGGRDIDALVAARVPGPAPLPGPAGLRLRLQLADFVRGLKHQLTDRPDVEDYFSADAEPVRLRRDELTAAVTPLIGRTVEACRALLHTAGVAPSDLAGVLLVGGSSRVPAVADAVAAALGRPVHRAEDPELAVVLGAAEWARHAGERRVTPVPPGPDETPLRWTLPGSPGPATLVRRLAEPGAPIAAGADLAVVRHADGSLWRLNAGETSGVLRHWQALPGATVAPGDWLATTGPAGTAVPVEHPAARRLRPAPPVHSDGVTAVAFNADGSRIAIARDTVVTVRETATGRQIGQAGFRTFISQVVFAGGGAALVVRTQTGGTGFWDLQEGRSAHGAFAAPVNRLAVSGDRSRVAALTDGRTVFVGAMASADTAQWRPLRELTGLQPSNDVALDATGTMLYGPGRDEQWGCWDVESGRLVREYPTEGVFGQMCALSPEGDRLAIEATSSSVLIVDPRTGAPIATLASHAFRGAFAPGGRWFAGAEMSGVHLWDVTTGRTVGEPLPRSPVVAFSPDGTLLATADGDTAVLWDVAALVEG
ncbi:Hsp70 family protein [Dactylosporangium sp. CS-047395]|uniref:Hsp70 family protein n=1 Tax=Dactylosporangium sp. CS-047395 TaxID=3239936 RepID=UPI003D8DB83E